MGVSRRDTTVNQTPQASGVIAHRSDRIAPGPRGKLFGASVPFLRTDPLLALQELTRSYGDVVRVRVLELVHLVNHPEHTKHVLQDNHLNYEKGYGYQRLRPLVGNGLLTSEGDFWKRQRRLAQPGFHKQRIAGFAALMGRHASAQVDRWNQLAPGTVVDVHEEMMRLTLGVVGDALFSIDLSGAAKATGTALSVATAILQERLHAPFSMPLSIPTPENRRLNRALEELDELVAGIIRERRQVKREREDLLSLLMEATDEQGGGMNDEQLRDEVMTMVLAGHETTANALSWAWFLLSRHPAVERALHHELQQVLAGRAPSVEDLPALPYTRRVCDEVLRLYPPAWSVARRAKHDDEIGGFHIPAGTSVVLSPWISHRDPRFWDNPEGFDPDRFLPEACAGRPPLAYFPFAAGPRMCIGNNFALMELQIVLATLVQAYRLNLDPSQRVETAPRITLRPRDGIRVSLHPRRPLPPLSEIKASTSPEMR
jgi:cytochrome P450